MNLFHRRFDGHAMRARLRVIGVISVIAGALGSSWVLVLPDSTGRPGAMPLLPFGSGDNSNLTLCHGVDRSPAHSACAHGPIANSAARQQSVAPSAAGAHQRSAVAPDAPGSNALSSRWASTDSSA